MSLHINLVQISRRGSKTNIQKLSSVKKKCSLIFVSFQGYQTNNIYVFKYYSVTKLTVKREPRFKLPELETFILKLFYTQKQAYIEACFLKEKSLSSKQVLTLGRFNASISKVLTYLDRVCRLKKLAWRNRQSIGLVNLLSPTTESCLYVMTLTEIILLP